MVWHVQNYNFSSIYQQNTGLFYHKKTYNAVLHNCFSELKDNAVYTPTPFNIEADTLTHKPADGWHIDFWWRFVATLFWNKNLTDENMPGKSVQTQISDRQNVKRQDHSNVQKIQHFNMFWTVFIGDKYRI